MITTDQQDINAFSQITDSKEKFYWTGGPNLTSFFVKTYLLPFIVLVLFSEIVLAPVRFFAEFLAGGAPYSSPTNSLAISAFTWTFTLAIFIIPLAIGLLQAKKLKYAFTKSRVLIRSGIIGTDFKILEYKQIRNAQVNVGLIDKLLGTGSIHIFTGETAMQYGSSKDVLFSIDNPYEIFKELRSKIDQARN